jgi:hypothetical protein
MKEPEGCHHATARNAGLLGAHSRCPFVSLEPSHDADGGRRVKKAVTETCEKKTGAAEFERRVKRRSDGAESNQEMSIKRGLAYAEAVGEPAAAEGGAGHRKIEGRKKQAHLRARKPELIFVERRERVDTVLRAGTDDVGNGDQRQNRPTERFSPGRKLRHEEA